MLIKDIIDSKAIALSATHAASNDIPYLGLQWFPEAKKEGLDLKWVKTYAGLPVILKPSNFDAIPTLRAREGLSTEKTQMAFFRESMQVTEEDEQEIARINDANDPYLESAVRAIYNDTDTLVRAAEVVPEVMRMALLTGQNIVLSSDGVNYTYDYDPGDVWAGTNFATLTSTDMWSDAEHAEPISDLNHARKELAKKGIRARYALMNTTTFGYLLASAQVRSAVLAQNATANIFMTDAIVTSVVKGLTGLDIVIYDKMYKGYDGADTNFYPDDFVTVLPDGKLGSTWYGTSPEERTARQVADVDVSIYGTGIAIATKVEYGPPAKTSVTASEIVLPSFEGMDSVYVIKVHTQGSTGDTGATGDTGDTGATGETA